MKIGDKVRFLNETGGGKIAGFKDKNIVLVEDEYGFNIPTEASNVIVVDDDDYSTTRLVEDKQKNKKPKREEDDTYEDDPADKEITFKMSVQEREGGDKLNCYLAFVPVDPQQITTTRFETYIINDSNYYMQCAYMTAEGANWTLRFCQEVEPNTKMFVEEFGKEDLNSLGRIAVQAIAYKREKTFIMKAPVGIDMRLDTVKFYKLHTFVENDFFDKKAYIIKIVEQDRPFRPLVIDTKAMEEVMKSKANADTITSNTTRRGKTHREKKDEPIEVDLHIHELLETTSGMSNKDILDYQMSVVRKTLDEYADKKGTKIVLIHGKGNGVLRKEIEKELRYRYKSYLYQDASFQQYGFGATMVTIR